MAPPVLLVHGFATSGVRTWSENGWVDLIGESGREVIVPDLLGHGTAEKPHDPLAYEHMHRDLLAVMPDQPIDAVGFSLGSRLLLMLATESPERFNHLILTATGEDVLRTHDMSSIADVLAGTGDPSERSPIESYFRQLAEAPGTDPMALAAVLRRSTNRALTAEELARATCRITIVVGDQDFAGPGQPLVDLLPNAALVTVRGVDHSSTPKSFDVIDTVLRLLDEPAHVS
jgi:pimeloyl-ACP methyl ester carboxylesterase